MTDPYTELGIPHDADAETIRAAYRKLSSEHHPDRGGDHERMAAINQAVAILSDPERRAKFDRTGDGNVKAPLEHRARELVFHHLSQVILQAPDFHNVIQIVRDLLHKEVVEALSRRHDFQMKLDRIEKRGARLKGGDLFKPLLQQLANQNREGAAVCDAHIELARKAEELIAGYEYEIDVGITFRGFSV